MNFDETQITTERRPARENVVRVDFAKAAERSSRRRALERSSDEYGTVAALPQKRSVFAKVKDIDLRAPWVFRLVAVLAILILSMLVL